jgi:hypothetical protein
MLYSTQTGGFYLREIHGDSIPADAVEITAKRHAELIAGQAAGQTIASGTDGAPILVNPPPPSLADVRKQAVGAMSAWIGQFLSQFTAGVPAEEIASWSLKAERARQHLAGDPQAIIIAEASITGEDPDKLAQNIAGKAGLYEAIMSRVTGLRRATVEAINKAPTPEAVAKVLASAQAQANGLAASLGVAAAK